MVKIYTCPIVGHTSFHLFLATLYIQIELGSHLGNPTSKLTFWSSKTFHFLTCLPVDKRLLCFLGKLKPLQASINDADGFKMRAACVCVRSRNEQEVGFKSQRNWLSKQELTSGMRGCQHVM